MLKDERENREKLEQNLIVTVGSAIEQLALQNGHITHQSISTILFQHQTTINNALSAQNTVINHKVNELVAAIGGSNQVERENIPTLSPVEIDNLRCRHMHYYDGRKRTWELWIIGQPGYVDETGKSRPIMPLFENESTVSTQKTGEQT